VKAIIIVLLIAAIGIGAYYYLSKKGDSPLNSKELIIGKWEVDSIRVKPPWSRREDSSLPHAFSVANSDLYPYMYNIYKNGLIISSLNEKVKDSSHYQFLSDSIILISNKVGTSKWWKIKELDSFNLILQGKDSAIFAFKKVR
jgi:hypothetical protein